LLSFTLGFSSHLLCFFKSLFQQVYLVAGFVELRFGLEQLSLTVLELDLEECSEVLLCFLNDLNFDGRFGLRSAGVFEGLKGLLALVMRTVFLALYDQVFDIHCSTRVNPIHL